MFPFSHHRLTEGVRWDWKGTIIFSSTSTLPLELRLSSLYLLLYSLVVAIVRFLFACAFLAFVDIGSLQRLEGLYSFSYNLTTKCVKMKAQAVNQILPNVLLIRKEKHTHTHKWPPAVFLWLKESHIVLRPFILFIKHGRACTICQMQPPLPATARTFTTHSTNEKSFCNISY